MASAPLKICSPLQNSKHLFVLNKQTFLRVVLYIFLFLFAMSKNSFTLNYFVFNQMILFCYQLFLFSFFSQTTQHNIKIKQNKTADTYSTSQGSIKGRERGKDNKNTKVTPLNNHVYSVKNIAKPQWLKAWPHRLAPLYIHMRQFAGGYGSNMPLYTCVV